MFQFVVRVVIFGTFASTAGGQELQIRPEPDSHTKAIGSAILFTCEAKNVSNEVNIKWFDNQNQEILGKNGRLYVEDDSKLVRKLYITSIQEEDAGRYSCQAVIGSEDDLTKYVSLEIYRDITFGDFPQEQHPKIHTDALISCVVTGQPVPVVSWRHMGNRVKGGERYSVTSGGLVIHNITESDNGEYTCRGEVESDGRYSERKISVTVHIPPTVTKVPEDVEAEQGTPIDLACEADGLPKPVYKFYKDGGDVPLESSENKEINETGGLIRFISLKKEDEGNYTCNATNRVGSDTGVGKLKVLVKPTITHFDDVVAVRDKQANVICVSEGDPQPTMTIRKEDTIEVYQLNSIEDTRVTVSSSEPGQLQLTIHNLTIEDAGRYICNASNKVGSTDKNATVTVHFKPGFTEIRKEVYNWVGKAHNLTCEPLAEPAANVTWVHGEAVLEENDNFHIYQSERSSTLQVTVREVDQSWIYGDYICRAKNNYGDAESIIEMKRATAPDVPLNVSVVERTPTAIVLEVDPPEDDGGDTISGYNVEYVERIQDVMPAVDEGSAEANETEVQVTTFITTTVKAVESSDRNIRVENLKANTTYVFKVRARNEVGLGNPYDYSATTDAFTKPQPIIINSVNMSKHPSEYTVTWEKPETGGKPIQQYEFSFRKVLLNKDMQKEEEVTDFPWSEEIIKDSSHILSHTLKGLSPSTHYQLKIRAVNEIGWSEPTNEFLFSTSEDPNASPPSTPEEESTTGRVVSMTTIGNVGDDEGKEVDYMKLTEYPKRFPEEDSDATSEALGDFEVHENFSSASPEIENVEGSTASDDNDDDDDDEDYFDDRKNPNISLGENMREVTEAVDDDVTIMTSELEEESSTAQVHSQLSSGPVIVQSSLAPPFLEIFFPSEDSKDAEASSQQAQAGTGLVVGIVLAVFVVFLIVVDVSCYFLNSCGLTMFLCGKLCKKEARYATEKAMEEGEREHLNQPTAPDEKNEEFKEPLKDEIPLEHPKAIKNEDIDVIKKPETTVVV